VSITTPEFHEESIKFDMWPVPADEILLNETTLKADFTLREVNDERPAYFGVLDYLLNQNNHISAYGGDLAYTLHFTSGFDGKYIVAPDVILFSEHNALVHTSYEQPSRNEPFTNRVNIVESNFQTISGKPVSRADFMMVLRDLKVIFIRANYWEQTLVTHLSDVYLTLADEDADGTSRSEEGACAMDTPTPVTSRTRRAQSASSHAVASITRAASSATSAVLDSSRKSGAKTPMPDHSTANVSIV